MIGRIGLLLPSTNTTVEVEFPRYVPDGVSIHSARLPLNKVTGKREKKMNKDVRRATKLLSDCEMDVIAYCCTTGSLIGGKGYEKEIERRISKISDRPSLATASAVVKALEVLGVKKIDIFTPYVQELNEEEVKFFSNYGFEVLNIQGLGIEENLDIGRLSPQRVYDGAKQFKSSESDALFLSCTNMPTLEIIEALEDDLRKPVITSNQATLWMALRTIKIDLQTDVLGKLFRLEEQNK